MDKTSFTQGCLSFSSVFRTGQNSCSSWVQASPAEFIFQCTPYCGVSGVRTKLLLANRNKNVSACHSHAQPCRTFCCQKITLVFRSVWAAQLAWGAVFFAADYRCSPANFPWVSHRNGALHYSHKCCGRGAGTVNNTLLLLWCTSCSITKLLHSCLLDLLDDDFRLLQAVLFLLILYRKKKKAIIRDRKQQFINIIQTCEILLPLRSCSNVWATYISLWS